LSADSSLENLETEGFVWFKLKTRDAQKGEIRKEKNDGAEEGRSNKY